MSSLAIQYSKELSKELGQIGVFLPGTKVSLGSIIYFKDGKKGLWPFRKPAPKGSFTQISSLNELGVAFNPSKPEENPTPYIFASKKFVSVASNIDADGSIPPTVNASGSISISFSKEGAVYFAGIGCKRTYIKDLSKLEVNLDTHKKDILWNDTFLVTGITIASKALIMQSNSKFGKLNVSGEVQGLVANSDNINAQTKLSVTGYKDAQFLMPWSDNVEVFVELHRFSKNVFGTSNKAITMANNSPFDLKDRVELNQFLISSPDDIYKLESVSSSEVLIEYNE